MPPSNILSQLRLAGIRVPQTSSSMRHFSPQCSSRYPRKDSQDKDSINTEATEYTKSGTDDQSAANEDAAFNSEITSPEEERKVAGKGNKGNPLEASPANKDISKQRNEQDGGAENSGGGSGKQSGFGSPQKKGGS
ncbi:hypothetical protein LARI1_G000292 [Lachnellula arida]|uniref:Uncharacterized protein n=1 Tax=Lachnellula arida TaxID=1316785 RepID=A0A8T9BQ08_9HELO|nr:hypothetical protein LARI1_G000292 [Lachnellula arida]